MCRLLTILVLLCRCNISSNSIQPRNDIRSGTHPLKMERCECKKIHTDALMTSDEWGINEDWRIDEYWKISEEWRSKGEWPWRSTSSGDTKNRDAWMMRDTTDNFPS
jgi:hypothetical protein